MSEFIVAGARVFDGVQDLGLVDVHVRDEAIVSVGGERPGGVEVVDGAGYTLLPGLIDAHVHTGAETLRQALQFGITTEFDLLSMPEVMIPLRRVVADSYELADVRSASVGLTPAGGHPHQLRHEQNDPGWPTATTPAEVAAFVEDRLAEGADYLKVLVEDGHVLGTDVPSLPAELVAAFVESGHRHGRMVLAHALTQQATTAVIAAGVDALTHLFVDEPHKPETIAQIADSGAFVIPTLTTLASITNQRRGSSLAQHPFVRPKLPPEWLKNLEGDWATQPSHHWGWALETLAALHDAGVDVLAGTDAAHLGAPGSAHGVSLHDELTLLTQAGWSAIEALRAATSLPAHRFNLDDRGRIAAGKRADLLLVAGNPIEDITSSLAVRAVWRQGHAVDLIVTA